MSKPMVGLDRDQIISLLDEISRRAIERGVRIEMFLVGGAAMVLAYSLERTTKDIEGIFEPKMIAYEIADEIARDSDFELPRGWLNDAVKIFPFPGDRIDEAARVLYEADGLNVRVGSPRYLFAMKAWAARESDEDDLRILWPLCGFKDARECLAFVEESYPTGTLKLKTQYLIEEIAQSSD